MARKDSDFMHYLRFSVTESAAATYTESEIDTNLSAERGVMMEIHSIDLMCESFGNLDEAAQATQEAIQWHVSRESKSAIILPDNADCILFDGVILVRAPTIGTDAGPMYFVKHQMISYKFERPIPYVKPSIFVATLGTDASGKATIRGRIGYTLRSVDRSEYLELLVALQ